MEIQEIQEIELNILEKFHEICVQNNLKYYIVGGTMLGAIRHNGFIPWDDDIDVAMPRKDYEEFNKISGKLLPNYLTQINENSEEYCYLFGKIFNNNTILEEYSLKKYNSKIGVYIDIFPLDNVEKVKSLFVKKSGLLKSYYTIKTYHLNNRTNIKKIICYIFQFFKFDRNFTKKKLHEHCKKFQNIDTEYKANFFGIYKDKEIMPNDYFGKPTLYQFENLEVYGVEKYHEYLEKIYGDYMKLPPLEKQISHHECSVIYQQGYDISNCSS